MRIMLGADTYPPDVNGAAHFAERLATGLVSRGHEVHMVAPSPVGRPFTENRDGVIVHRIRSHRYPLVENFQICMPWEARPAIAKIVRDVRPDVCHAQAHFICGRYLIIAADEQDIPLIATNHFMPENLFQHARTPQFLQAPIRRLAWWDLGRVFRRADLITAPTPRAVELLHSSSARLEGCLPVSCGIDAEKFASKVGDFQPNDPPVILFVGRLDEEKRVNELIDAAALLAPKHDFEVHLVGDGAMREKLIEQAKRLGISDRIKFLGFISEEELIWEYGHCDIFCQPCIAELQSLATLEAMSASKPVVLADAMALPHLCRIGENGYLFQPTDIHELASHLEELIVDPDKRVRFGKVSHEMVGAHAISATLDRFTELYEQVIAKHSTQDVQS